MDGAVDPYQSTAIPPSMLSDDPYAATAKKQEDDDPYAATAVKAKPAPSTEGATVQAAPEPSFLHQVRDAVANSAIGHSLESTLPGAADLLHLHPSESMASPTYQQHGEQLIAPEYLQPTVEKALTPTGVAPAPMAPANKERLAGALGAAGELTSGSSLATMAGTAVLAGATAGVINPASSALLGRLISGGFTLDMLRGLYHQNKEYKAAVDRGDVNEAHRIQGAMGVTGVMALLTAKHAASGVGKAMLERGNESFGAARPGDDLQLGRSGEHKNVTPGVTPKPADVPPVSDPTRTFTAAANASIQPPSKDLVALAGEATNQPQDLGGTHKESGRDVLQPTDNPAQLDAAAQAAAPELSQRLESAVGNVSGAKLDAVRPRKGNERLVEKLTREGQPAATIPDYLASRVIVDSPKAHREAVAAIKKQFGDPVRDEDNFDEGDDKFGYRHHALQVQMSNGVTAEVHVVPKEIAAINADEHEDYKQAREADLAGNTETFKKAAEEAKAKNDAAMAKFDERNGIVRDQKEAKSETAKTSTSKPETKPKYDYGNTQTNIPEESEAGRALAAVRGKIDENDLRASDFGGDGKGLETDPHVTVRYGIQGDDTGAIEKYLRSQPPFEAQLGEISSFPGNKNTDGAAVLKANVESPELHRMNAEIEKHGNFKESDFPDYVPHATVAYVKPEAAAKYVGMKDTEGKTFPVKSVAISDRNGNTREIPLQGERKGGRGESPEPAAGGASPAQPKAGMRVAVYGHEVVPDGTEVHLWHWNDHPEAKKGRGTAFLPDGTTKRISMIRADQIREIPPPVANTAEPDEPWIGVDLDGTLAHYTEFKGKEDIGKPIPAMVGRVKQWLADGKQVKIFTARIANDPGGLARKAIDRWSEQHLGQKLPITNVKDEHMTELYDDRAVQVGRNTGEIIGDGKSDTGKPTVGAKLGEGDVSAGTNGSGDKTGQLGGAGGGRDGSPPPEATGAAERPKAVQDVRREPEPRQDGAGKVGPVEERDKIEPSPPPSEAKRTKRTASQVEADLRGKDVKAGFKERYRAGELNAAKTRTLEENAKLAKTEISKSPAAQHLKLNADALYAIGRTYDGDTDWVAVTLPPDVADDYIAKMREGGLDKIADAMESARLKSGTLILHGPESNPQTVREEDFHAWQVDYDLQAGVIRDLMKQPLVQHAAELLRTRGYGADDQTVVAEATAKAAIGDREFFTPVEAKALNDIYGRILTEHGVALEHLEPTLRIALRRAEDGQQSGDTPARPGEARKGLHKLQEPQGRRSGAGPEGRGEGAEGGEEADVRGPEDGRPLYQRRKLDDESGPTWYLKSQKLIDEKMRGPMAGPDVLRMLENGGVKPDELKWTGLRDFLRGKLRVKPEEVRQHLAEGGIQIEEITHGGVKGTRSKEELPDGWIAQQEHDGSWQIIDRETGEPQTSGASREEAVQNALEFANKRPENALEYNPETKYPTYQLPGGENYRELLLTLPTPLSKEAGALFDLREKLDAKYGIPFFFGEDSLKSLTPNERAEYKRVEGAADATEFASKPRESFRSGHWDEPNILAHVRFNDRTTPDGKRLLHIEEIQSDWHQKGRDKGYKTENPPELSSEEKEFGELVRRDWNPIGTLNEGDRTRMRELRESGVAESYKAKTMLSEQGVPDAPFKKDWHEMAFRRLVRMAAEQGYDGVSWTPGEKQAERYDLSQHIDQLRYDEYEGKYDLLARKDGKKVFGREHVTADELPGIVGKEVARKIVESAPEKSGWGDTLTGLDLKVGGEGMKGFYDKIIPDYARKFGKQWGAKVGESEIPEVGGADKSGYFDYAHQEGGYEVFQHGGDAVAIFDTPKEAAAEVDRRNALLDRGAMLRVPTLEITPEMRKDVVQKGVALFQRKPEEERLILSAAEIRKSRIEADRAKAESKTEKKVRERELLEAERQKQKAKQPEVDKSPAERSSAALERLRERVITRPKVERSLKEKLTSETAASGRAMAEDTGKVVEGLQTMREKMGDAWESLRKPKPPTTSYMQAYGNYELEKTESALEQNRMGKDLNERVPDKKDRIAMTDWIQSGGDVEKLKYREKNSKPEHRAGYRMAQFLTNDQKAIARQFVRYYDEQEGEAKRAGFVEQGKADYLMQIYVDHGKPGLQSLVNYAALKDDPGIFEHSTYRNYFEAESAGQKPKDKDLGWLTNTYDKVFGEAVRSRAFIRQLLETREADGRPTAILKRDGNIMQIGPENDAYLMDYKPRDDGSDPLRSDYVTIDHPVMRSWFWQVGDIDESDFTKKEIELLNTDTAVAMRGDVLVHPAVEKHLRNLLTTSAIRKTPVLRELLWTSRVVKDLMFTGSGTHQMIESTLAAVHGVNPINLDAVKKMATLQGWANPFRLDDTLLDLRKGPQAEDKRLLVRNGLMLADFPGEEAWSEAMASGAVRYMGPVGKLLGDYRNFMFRDLIPKFKMGMALKALKRNKLKYSNKMDTDQIAQLTAREANATFSGINWKRMGVSDTVVDLARLTLLAPDFELGQLSTYAQALKPGGAHQRLVFARAAIITYVAARVLNYLLNDGDMKMAKEDAFKIVHNGKSYGIRTPITDAYSFATDPRMYIMHRLNPVITRTALEAATGKDDYGRAKTPLQVAGDALKTAIPINLQGAFKNQDIDWTQSFLGGMGIHDAKYYTPAETMAHKLRIGHFAATEEDEDTINAGRAARKLEDGLRAGTTTTTEVWNAVQAGKITPHQAGAIQRNAHETKLMKDYKGLTLKEALDVYEKANAAEKADLRPALAAKRKELEKAVPEVREKLEARLEKVLR